MKKTFIRIAIIGAGKVTHHYKEILSSSKIKDYKIVGICDVVKKSAEYFADFWECDFFDDLNLMINKVNPDLVFVLTPSGLHYQHALEALNLNCHVLVEKPISMNPREGKHLMNLAHSKSLMLCVAFQNRLNPSIQALHRACLQNRFGKIISATIRLRWCRYQEYYEDGWHGTWNQDGGVINQQAIHHLDALNWLVGPVEKLCSESENMLNNLEAEDTMIAILKFKNGALGTIEATTAARPHDYEASLSIVGEKGLVVIGGTALNKIETWNFVNKIPEDEFVADKFSYDVKNGYGNSHEVLIEKTIENLKEGNVSPLIPIEESIQTTELVHALYSSDEKQSWVYLQDNPISKKLGN